jgi:uncharacterized protein HemX
MAQSQSYKTGKGRVQTPEPTAATREAPSSGFSLSTGTLLVTGAIAAAAGLGLALVGSGGDDDDAPAADSNANVVGTATK